MKKKTLLEGLRLSLTGDKDTLCSLDAGIQRQENLVAEIKDLLSREQATLLSMERERGYISGKVTAVSRFMSMLEEMNE